MLYMCILYQGNFTSTALLIIKRVALLSYELTVANHYSYSGVTDVAEYRIEVKSWSSINDKDINHSSEQKCINMHNMYI